VYYHNNPFTPIVEEKITIVIHIQIVYISICTFNLFKICFFLTKVNAQLIQLLYFCDIIIHKLKNVLTHQNINEQIFSNYLTTKDIPDPELLIRTSGEYRIPNFLLWQIAYSELYFTNKLSPDYRKNDFYEAIIDYQTRERRFGKTSEQLSNESWADIN